MGYEIERKFLVCSEAYREFEGVEYRQGYLSRDKGCTVRVRVAGDHGYITVKGRTVGHGRPEYEYEIPVGDAREMLDGLCPRPLIEKRRHRVPVGAHVWEVDEFFGDNAGLVLAEIELSSADEPFARPEWVGDEVSDDPRYYNVNLVQNPYCRWGTPG